MGFLCWLTTREESVTVGRWHDAGVAVNLLERFAQHNALGTLDPNWRTYVVSPEGHPMNNAAPESFQTQLTRLIHQHRLEGGSDTPDFVLADYLVQCLAVFDVTIAHRESWYGRPLDRGTERTPAETTSWP